MELRFKLDDGDIQEGDIINCYPIMVTYKTKGGGKVTKYYYSIEELLDEWEDV